MEDCYFKQIMAAVNSFAEIRHRNISFNAVEAARMIVQSAAPSSPYSREVVYYPSIEDTKDTKKYPKGSEEARKHLELATMTTKHLDEIDATLTEFLVLLIESHSGKSRSQRDMSDLALKLGGFHAKFDKHELRCIELKGETSDEFQVMPFNRLGETLCAFSDYARQTGRLINAWVSDPKGRLRPDGNSPCTVCAIHLKDDDFTRRSRKDLERALDILIELHCVLLSRKPWHPWEASIFDRTESGKLKYRFIEQLYENCHPLAYDREDLRESRIYTEDDIAVLQWAAKKRLREHVVVRWAERSIDVSVEEGPTISNGHQKFKKLLEILDDEANHAALEAHDLSKHNVLAALFA